MFQKLQKIFANQNTYLSDNTMFMLSHMQVGCKISIKNKNSTTFGFIEPKMTGLTIHLVQFSLCLLQHMAVMRCESLEEVIYTSSFFLT